MPSLLSRVFGPSRRELGAQLLNAQGEIARLQERTGKFPRRNAPLASGVDMGWGDFEYETNTKLQGAAKFGVFDDMETDPHVKGVLMEKALPLLTAEWEIQPASESTKDKDIAEFCSANLLRTPSDKYGREYWIGTSWKAQRLAEIMSMLRDGFSLFVSTWRRAGTNVVYDRLQWIEPQTIDGTVPWEIDDQDRIIAINRKLTTPTQKFLHDERIEADRLKLYVWDMKGARYEGRSFVRSMYGAWLRKEFFVRQAAVWAQKVGAPVPIGHYPEGWDATQIARFLQFVKALRGSSPAEAFGMFRKTADGNEADVSYAGSETGEVDRMRGLIDGENQEIHHGGRDSSAMLGETESGSRALGDSKGKREVKFTQAVAETVGEWETHGVGNLTGVIEELVDRNFAVSAYPMLVCTKVDPFENFDETLEAWKAGLIPKIPEARKQIVEGTLGLNLPDDAYEIQEPPPLPAVSPPGSAPDPDSANDSQDQQAASIAAAAKLNDATRARIAELLKPSREGAPKSGGRFPDGTGGGVLRAGGGAGDVSGRGTGRAGGAAADAS